MEYIKKAILVFVALAAGFAAPAALAQDWWNEEWSYRKEIVLNAGEEGVRLEDELEAFPTLIRLSADSFRFADAKFDGADIRFATADGRRLNHFVESYDVNGSLGFVWLEVPDIEAGAEQSIFMYFGNPAADDTSQSSLVYDADYALVYNFGNISGVPQDATSNLNNARSSITVRPGFIGNAAAFEGASFLRTPPSPSLRTPQEGSFTFSTWLKIEERQARSVVYARSGAGEDQTPLFVVGVDGRTPFVEVNGLPAEGEAAPDIARAPWRITADSELDIGAWRHLALRVEGGETSTVTLYVNGDPVASGRVPLPVFDGVTYFGGLDGAQPPVDAAPLEAEAEEAADDEAASVPYGQFVGMLDEIRISRIARSENWIRASWLDQGPEGALVQFGNDEELTEEFFNFDYFIVVVQNLSAEAWGVIAILAGMLVIAIATIFAKSGLINNVERTNKRFRKDYAAAEALDVINGKYGPSGMARVYRTAISEVARRGGAEGVAGARLDASALVAIRSEVDAALTDHIQGLNRRMVLLTIAISGGPFLGLLGTVLGVMITFAGVAAEGNVNINAIAPGVAAALLTTVSGLTVAIPSMFAYNWLTTRIREIASQTRVFSNTLTARIADTFSA